MILCDISRIMIAGLIEIALFVYSLMNIIQIRGTGSFFTLKQIKCTNNIIDYSEIWVNIICIINCFKDLVCVRSEIISS